MCHWQSEHEHNAFMTVLWHILAMLSEMFFMTPIMTEGQIEVITSDSFPKSTKILEHNTKRTNNNHFHPTQRMCKKWAENHATLHAVQMMTLNYARVVTCKL
jgi:hypothetical protein